MSRNLGLGSDILLFQVLTVKGLKVHVEMTELEFLGRACSIQVSALVCLITGLGDTAEVCSLHVSTVWC